MNSMQLKAKIKNISKEKNIDFNTLLRLYMYDRFLERLSKSKYIDNFILGWLLFKCFIWCRKQGYYGY